jgi:hypothetical protein
MKELMEPSVRGVTPEPSAGKPERVTEMEGFEALCCWLHQCTESDVPKVSKLWQLIEIITGRIAVDMVLLRTPERAWPAEFLWGGLDQRKLLEPAVSSLRNLLSIEHK